MGRNRNKEISTALFKRIEPLLPVFMPSARGKLGSKRHLITDRQGIPLIFCVTGANRHNSVVFEQLVDVLPDVRGRCGRPRRWPKKLHADKG